MPALASCPPSAELEQFLLGRLEDVDSLSLEFHLASCTVCQQQLTTLAAEDEFVQALRNHSQRTFSAHSSAQRTAGQDEFIGWLVPHFKQIATSFEETASFVSALNTAETTPPPSARIAKHGAFSNEAVPPTSLGRYEIRGVLGHGGMGTVLHAFDPLLKRSLAIKVIRAKLLDQGMAERLVREAQAAAAVEHDHIVPVYAVEVYGGVPCLMMPLLRGLTLKHRLEETSGPLPLVEILRIGREAASGLAAAHAVGLIHCDIKPANLWLEAPRDRVKVLDFGLAIVRDDQESESAEIAGTPGYLAPEQARGEPLDSRTDVFSLGCVLYRMATGEAPFSGERHLRALWTVVSAPPRPVAQLNSAVPAELSDLIGRMLSRDPQHRPASAAAVAEALEALELRLHEQHQRTTRRRWIAAMFVVALLSGCGVGLWSLLMAPAAAAAVSCTFFGDEPPVEVVLLHAGQEQALTLGREKTLELLPGDYTLRLATASRTRMLQPEHFTVVAEQPQTLRIALVGEVTRHAMHTQPVTGVAVLPGANTTIFSVGLDRALVAWEPASIKVPRFVDLQHSARCVAVAPKGDDVATAGGNKFPPAELGIRIWKTNDLSPRGNPLAGHSRMVNAVAYSPAGGQLASADAEGVLLWNLATGESTQLLAEPQFVYALAYSANGQELLTGNDEGQVDRWDVGKRVRPKTHNTGASPVRAVAFLSQRVVTAGDDGIIRIWNAGSLQHEWLGSSEAVLALAVSPDGKQILSGDAAGELRCWSVATGKTIWLKQAHTQAVQAVAFLANGRQAVSGGSDGAVSLWQLPFAD